MRFTTLAFAALATLGALVSADPGAVPNNYPIGCPHECGPVVTQSQNCGAKGIPCICARKGMDHLVPLCVACSKVRHAGGAADFHAGECEKEKKKKRKRATPSAALPTASANVVSSAVVKVSNQCDFHKAQRTYTAAGTHATPALGAGALAAVAAFVL